MTGIALAFGFVLLAFFEAVALVAIVFRYAIPRSPGFFHSLVALPMAASIAASIALAANSALLVASLSGSALLWWLLVFAYASAGVFCVLDIYSLYWHLRGRHLRSRDPGSRR